MSAPRQTCQLCGNLIEVELSMRGFPPDTARTKLKRLCISQGCACDPQYTAGIDKTGFMKVLTPDRER